MFITELFLAEESTTNGPAVEPTPRGYATEKDDQSILKLSDMRKTRLTLGQINKLRQMNDIKKIEHQQKLRKLAVQYKPAEPDSGGM